MPWKLSAFWHVNSNAGLCGQRPHGSSRAHIAMRNQPGAKTALSRSRPAAMGDLAPSFCIAVRSERAEVTNARRTFWALVRLAKTPHDARNDLEHVLEHDRARCAVGVRKQRPVDEGRGDAEVQRQGEQRGRACGQHGSLTSLARRASRASDLDVGVAWALGFAQRPRRTRAKWQFFRCCGASRQRPTQLHQSRAARPTLAASRFVSAHSHGASWNRQRACAALAAQRACRQSPAQARLQHHTAGTRRAVRLVLPARRSLTAQACAVHRSMAVGCARGHSSGPDCRAAGSPYVDDVRTRH